MEFKVWDIVTWGYDERRWVIVNVKSSELVIEIDSEYNDYKWWENNWQDKDIPSDYKPVLSNRYSLIWFDDITSHIKKESKLEPDKFNWFVKYENWTRCKIIWDHNCHNKKIWSIITITEYTWYAKHKDNWFAYKYEWSTDATVFRSIDLEEVKEEVSTFKVWEYVEIIWPLHCYSNSPIQAAKMWATNYKIDSQLDEWDIVKISAIDTEWKSWRIVCLLTSEDWTQRIYDDKWFMKSDKVSTKFKVWDYVKYESWQAIYIITTLVWDTCYIKHILGNNVYTSNINRLELVRPEHLQWLDDDWIRYSSNYNPSTWFIDSIELLKIDESILNTYVILNKYRWAQLDIEWYESRWATCNIEAFNISYNKPYSILICEEDWNMIRADYDSYEEMIDDNKEDWYRLISNWIDNNEVNLKPTWIIKSLQWLQWLKADFAIIDEAAWYDTLMKEAQKDFADAFASSLEKTILNTNTKPTMSTLSKIQTEEFFSNKKNVKAIEETTSELNRLERSFEIVMNDLDNKINRIQRLRSNLNWAVSNDDIKSIQEQLVVLKPRVEFLNRYEENTIKELWFTETKVTSPEDFFKS